MATKDIYLSKLVKVLGDMVETLQTLSDVLGANSMNLKDLGDEYDSIQLKIAMHEVNMAKETILRVTKGTIK